MYSNYIKVARRIDMNLIISVLDGLMSLVIATLTASCQTIKATLINPVETLRYE
jgi:hypothetical protein